jgi:hypothetical protein
MNSFHCASCGEERFRSIVVSEELLLPAIRQYKHNTGEDGFIFGYDKEETQKVVHELLQARFWRPIDEKARSLNVDVFAEGKRMVNCFYQDGNWHNHVGRVIYPTHYMEVPDNPTQVDKS